VIPVDECDVDRGDVRQHVVADVAVEDVSPREALLVLGRVEFRNRIDHVQLGVRPEPFQHERGRLTAQGPDLDDPLGARGLEHRPDHAFPERIHASGCPALA
jgi:hypothetical protein